MPTTQTLYYPGAAPARIYGGRTTQAAPRFSAVGTYISGTRWDRGGALTGAVASRYGSISVEIEVGAIAGGAFASILSNSSQRVQLERTSTGQIRMALTDGVNTYRFGSVATFSAGARIRIQASWDTGAAAGARVSQFLVDGVSSNTLITDTGAAFDCPYNLSAWSVGARTDGLNPFTGTVKELMFWPGVYIDWTTGIPAQYAAAAFDPGADGSVITGTAPSVYLSNRSLELAPQFGVNRGTGGNFTVATGVAAREDRALISVGDSFVASTGASTPTLGWATQTGRQATEPF